MHSDEDESEGEYESEEEESESEQTQKLTIRSMGSYDPKKHRMLDIPSDESNIMDQSLRADFNPDIEKFNGKNFDWEKLNDMGLWNGDVIAGDRNDALSSDESLANLNQAIPNTEVDPNAKSKIRALN